LVLAHIYLASFTVLDTSSDLRRGFAVMRLLIGIKRLAHAHITAGTVLAGEAIEQARMANAAVAMAVAGLLVQNWLYPRGQGVSVLNHYLSKKSWRQGGGEFALRWRVVKGRHRIICGLSQA